jgi:hypothetical protein
MTCEARKYATQLEDAITVLKQQLALMTTDRDRWWKRALNAERELEQLRRKRPLKATSISIGADGNHQK